MSSCRRCGSGGWIWSGCWRMRRCRLPPPGQDRLLYPQSRFRDKRQNSRGNLDRLPHATAESTTSAFDGYGLRDQRFARPAPYASDPVCAFAPCFFETPPRGDALAHCYHFTSMRRLKGTFTFKPPIMPGTPQRGCWPLAHSPSPRLARNTGGATPVNENGGWAEIHMAPGISASTRPNVEDRTGEPKEAVSLIDIQFSKSISGRLTMDFSKISAAVSDLASRCSDQDRAR